MEDKTAVDVLRATREWLCDPAHWTQGYGGELGEARCIVRAAAKHGASTEALHLLQAVLPNGGDDLVAFNDAPSTTHADVLALFDAAISRASR